MTQALTFRFATLSDADAITANVERAYRGEESARGWTSEAHLMTNPRLAPGEIAGIVADPDARFVMAESAGELLATALITNEGSGVAYFGLFAVVPARQAGGIGRTVLAECEDRARTLWGAKIMRMTVISVRSELIAYYERRGYTLTGERKPLAIEHASGAAQSNFDLLILEKKL